MVSFFEADTLIPMMPKHEWYGEPFFGSGVMLYNKPVADEEYANDLFSCLVSFWEVIKKARLARRLINRMEKTWDSRYVYQRYMHKKPEELNMVDRAYRFLYLVKFGFNSFMNCYYKPITKKMEHGHDFMRKWLRAAKRVWEAHERFQRVHFSNYDFSVFLDEFTPHKGKLLFVDPPYIDTHSYDEYYNEGVFGKEKYKTLLDKLNYQSKNGTDIMITCSPDNDLLDDLHNAHIKYITRRTCINKNETRVKIQSKVIMNYDPDEVQTISLMKKKEEGDILAI